MGFYMLGDYINVSISGGSSDVLHSFSLLELGVHTDCIPGKLTEHSVVVHLELEEYVTCQELCGYGHSGISLLLEL